MPPKNFQLTFAWTLVATILMGAAIWQAQVTTLKEAAAKHAPPPPPLKTRHAIRPPAPVFTGNIVDDYVARCGKGITDREISWILEDFRNAGADENWRDPKISELRFHQLLAGQEKWFIDALRDGLRLDPVQTGKAREKLAALFKSEADAFAAERREANASGTGSRGRNEFPWLPESLDDPFISSGPIMPWILCDLTAEQERITWKVTIERRERKSGSGPAEAPADLTNAPLFRFSGPDTNPPTKEKTPPSWASIPNLFLPITAGQNLIMPVRPGDTPADPFEDRPPPNDETLLSNVRRLHPGQLKILLLFDPEMASELGKELEDTSH